MTPRTSQILAAGILVAVVAALIAQALIAHETVVKSVAVVAIVLVAVLAYCMLTGQGLRGVNLGFGDNKFDLTFIETHTSIEKIEQRTMDDKTLAEKEAFALEIQQEHSLPGKDAPQFSAIIPANSDDLLVRPSAYPMTPMYLLDNAYRIIDWNEAFTIAFDRTMEGRKGRSVLEWTYFLDNYEQVLDHGVKAFSDTNKLPLIDVEPIEYTSRRYGKLTAIKRAYQIPDDAGACLAWLVTLDIKFADTTQQMAFHGDVLGVLSLDLMWSDYAMSYDRVLNATKSYPLLLQTLIGGLHGVREIPQDAKIIDLGAGTGNLAYNLVVSGRDRLIYAADNNRMMLELLRAKCRRFIRTDAGAGGIIALKQDITSLFGLEDNYFDFALMNNVLYSIKDTESCLNEAYRVLRRGGEIRLSGPRRDTKVEVLFNCLMKEIKESGKYTELESDFQRVLEINQTRLRPMLMRWSTDDVKEMLVKAGFTPTYSTDDIYAGQSMLVCASKN